MAFFNGLLAGERLLEARSGLLSKQVRNTFGQYAESQLRRIRGHRNWLFDPPTAPPERRAYGLPEETVIPKDQLGAAQSLIDREDFHDLDVSENFLEQLRREKAYTSARREWQQYQNWKKQRNRQRAALEAKFGYDTKHAMHLVRLLRMAIEILEEGRAIVKRPDRDELLAIRGGAWSYDDLIASTDSERARLDAAHRSSALPDFSDAEALDALGIELIDSALRERD